MGVPVVTLVSDRPAGQQSVRILQTLDASNWIAHREEEFVQPACACANDRDALVLSRQGLRKKWRPPLGEMDACLRMALQRLV
jgi:predicted O-linked N-acetylglucosamine transferase (SPINDLY family)